ncbi:MAG: DNA polymerase III subunit beta [Candidatus Woykebacteria bacterium RBG_13_40_7b]|uniref:Beta sliding clamp n=1 Tax=Candidatus Woykebacteria bacterium RBG_13_40_7b TaxID=1802594 RepID=A0A1G1WBB2_9BACT|nr:MAG: DNA polymerase III subunit beta [Candidatus Woykebacteria bacterium RBG_13_40_7b]
MKATLLKENFLKALSIASKAISLKATLPVLNNCLIESKENKLYLTTTNLETGINIYLPAKTEEAGILSIPARPLLEFVNAVPEEKILIESTDESLTVSSGYYKATLSGISASEFPSLPKVSQSNKVGLQKDDLISAVLSVSFCASIDESRAPLTGLLIKGDEKETTFVATDGYRLSEKKIKGQGFFQGPLLIPSRAAIEVARIAQEILKDKEQIVYLSKEENELLFTFGEVEFFTRLIDSPFPSYQAIIPTGYSTQARVSLKALEDALKSVSVISKEGGFVAKLAFAKGGTLSLSSAAPQVGEAQVQVEGDVEGEGVSVAFNIRYLLEALNIFTGPSVSFKLTSPTSPVLLQDEAKADFIHIIMPIRVQA